MNVSDYIGLPFEDAAWGPDSFDCWGLLVWVYKREFGIDIHMDLGTYTNDREKIMRFAERVSFWKPTSKPVTGDGVLFLIGGKIPHCGIYVGDNKMLHTIKGSMSCIQRIDDVKWKSRFEGYYSYS